MIKWFRKNTVQANEQDDSQQSNLTMETAASQEKKGLFSRFKEGLTKTRQHVGENIARLLLGKKEVDSALLEELESLLISADLGVETSQKILETLTQRLARKELSNGDALYQSLKSILVDIIQPLAQPLTLEKTKTPFVILMVGINGAGKTTTIGKLAKQFQQQGNKVMLAAGDTFRAAAVEQLQTWGLRNDIPVIAQHTGADSASVIFDAFQSAKNKGVDILIADTAGRLHTQNNLMEELKKIKRVMQKIDVDAPHEIMLVLDASIGQNAVNQAKEFHNSVGVSGITMTKLDGTARGGILFAIAHHLQIPFRYIGIGEGIDELRAFDAQAFVEALFSDD